MAIVLDGTLGITTPDVTTDDGDVYAKGNILGTVSESSGVPTGAIIERGSNANGEFVKYADGTMICTKNIGNVDPVTTATMATIPYWADDWTYPSAFVASPSLSTSGATRSGTGGRGWATHTNARSTTSCNFRHTSMSSAAFDNVQQVAYTAIGRWY
jgi:hypothetical protein